jgi:erythronate-4-phosphate dehydrogenase
MKLVVDQNIPFAREAFGTLGDVTTLAGRDIRPEHVRHADALIVRSITKVNAALLAGSPVRFVGTCTIGEDHVDKAWLAAQGIGFSSAPGCNANSVSEYITAALLELRKAGHLARPLRECSLGVIGHGHVGSKVAAKARALGMRVVVNDPPLTDATGDPLYRPLSQALDCDVVTLHVPLEKGGPHPTRHLADAAFLSSMKSGAVLINTARGPVVESDALLEALDSGHLSACVLDVWEGEPEVPTELITNAFLASPHIAGYSFDGKVNGTVQIYEALCRHQGIIPTWTPEALLPAPDVPELSLPEGEPDTALLALIRQVYDIRRDDAALREALALPEEERGKHFDALRKNYPRRREFQHTTVCLPENGAPLAPTLIALGFKLNSR